jgi:hypothetical protein
MGFSSVARSISVCTGFVTGIPKRRTVLASGSFGRHRTLTPDRSSLLRRRIVTSIRPFSSKRIPQSSAALRWLSTAPLPQESTAAIHFPRCVSSARPTA